MEKNLDQHNETLILRKLNGKMVYFLIILKMATTVNEREIRAGNANWEERVRSDDITRKQQQQQNDAKKGTSQTRTEQ